MIQQILLLWEISIPCARTLTPVHHFSPQFHISANKFHAGSSSPAFFLWLPKSFPSRGSSSCPSAGRALWGALALTKAWGLFSSLGAAAKAEVEKGQKLLVLLQKPRAAYGGVRMVEQKCCYLSWSGHRDTQRHLTCWTWVTWTKDWETE